MTRRCLGGCGTTISTGTRCRTCANTHERHRRPSFTARYGPTYPADRAAVLAPIDGVPPRCAIALPGCTLIATTCDHDPALATYPPGQWRGRLRPACASCNASLGGQTRRTQ